jgi:hypothetical protein
MLAKEIISAFFAIGVTRRGVFRLHYQEAAVHERAMTRAASLFRRITESARRGTPPLVWPGRSIYSLSLRAVSHSSSSIRADTTCLSDPFSL